MTNQQGIELYSGKFYAACAAGGALSCGLTHTAITPLDVVKCRMQTGAPYKNTFDGIATIYRQNGMGLDGLFKGAAPTLVGYSIQGLCKFGFYEYFKRTYAVAVGEENAEKYKSLLYIAASASAEFIADIGLCPWEAVKVRVQTQDGWARGLSDGLPKFIAEDGMGGLFRGVVPLWSRQIPYTVMKFLGFERIVEGIYKNALSKPKEEYNKMQQLGVTFAAGYLAGILCATVSHPADVIVSKLNKQPGGSVVSIAKELGFWGCWTGLPVRIAMIGTLTGLQWLIYDAFKASVGLPTSGGSKVVVEIDDLAEQA
eukprot:CAMPEP_0117451290 /NCGR_PEP_ID=MMETSP0759-20121206/8927_1 /TAXON_ID=63605 /ORGANISM="Percolomonas cosmopolitus, Strain WS" /LENGTH=312 /DNA_ID=CAMNT_0005243877 /DNA_START=6 /DNA_END=944 /DNA_ORIENTATION=+